MADIHTGKMMSLVTIQVGDQRLMASITNEGVKELQRTPKDTLTAVVKSTEVLLIKGGLGSLKLSASNKLTGQVASVQKGQAMGLVTAYVGTHHVGAAITRQAFDEMGWAEGDTVTVVIKATEVLLMK